MDFRREREDLITEIISYIIDHKESGIKMSTPQAVSIFQPKIQELGLDSTTWPRLINRRMLSNDWNLKEPMLPGPKCSVPAEALKVASSYLMVMDDLGRKKTIKDAARKVKAMTKPLIGEHKFSTIQSRVLEAMLKYTDLRTFKKKRVESQRWSWCTYENINKWFNDFFHFCVERGHAKIQQNDFIDPKTGEKHTSILQFRDLSRVINMDETKIVTTSMDGAGGVQERVCSRKNGSVPAAKGGCNFTGVFATTPAGELLPPWVIFTTESKENHFAPLPVLLTVGLPYGRGKFGRGKAQEWSSRIACNHKAGVDDLMFRRWIVEVVVDLYPDLQDSEGKRILIVVDGGVGRVNEDTVDFCRSKGIDLFPKVPHTTAVTQEMDRLYTNLDKQCKKLKDKMMDELCAIKECANLSRYHVARILTGCKCAPPNACEAELQLFSEPDDEFNPFGYTFTEEKIRHAWIDVGAVPYTKMCLSDVKVRHSVDGDNEEADRVAANAREHTNNLLLAAQAGMETRPFVPCDVKAVEKRDLTEVEQCILDEHAAEKKRKRPKVSTVWRKVGYVGYTSDVFQQEYFEGVKQCAREEEEKRKEREKLEADRHAKAMEILTSGKEPSKLKKSELDAVLKDKGIKIPHTKAESLELYQQNVPATPSLPAASPANSP